MDGSTRASTTPTTIRAARRAEHAAIRRVLRDSFGEYAAVVPAAIFTAYLDDLCDLEGRTARSELLVAEVDGEVVGTITLYADGRDAHGFDWPASTAVVRALGVAPRRRGAGIAAALLEACIERAAANGSTEVGLHTAEFMIAAGALYARRGFTRRPDLDVLAGEVLGGPFAAGPLAIASELSIDRDQTGPWPSRQLVEVSGAVGPGVP